MSLQSWQETLMSQPIAGSAFATFTTAKTVIPATCLVTLPANYFQIGKTLRVTALGALGTLVTTPGLVAFQVMLGTAVVFTTGNIQLNATAHTTKPFWFQAYLTCRAVGTSTSANFMGQAILQGIQFTLTAAQVDAVNTAGAFAGPSTLPAVGAGFDSTLANILDFFVGFTISDAANTIQIQQYTAEALN